MLDFDGVALKSELVDIVNQAGGNLKRVSGEWRGRCVLHGGDNSSAFAVYSDNGKQKWKCFTNDCGCGDVYDFVMKWNKCDLKTAYRILGGEENPDPAMVTRAAVERAERAEQQLRKTIDEAQKALHELQEARSWEKYHQQLENSEEARVLWENRGIPEVFQGIWRLGYCNAFKAATSEGMLVTPTLTIPIFGPDWELLNIRHRLLNPITPNDKYRPERSGLAAAPFMCDPDNGWNLTPVFLVEGEVKAMVTYIALDSTKWQILGIPGKTWKGDLCDKLQGHDVWICLDPDAGKEAQAMAKAVKGRIINLPGKIDDMINDGAINQDSLRSFIRQARKL